MLAYLDLVLRASVQITSAAIALVMLCSCSPEKSQSLRSASPAAKQTVFSSEEEALDQARKTYSEYLRIGQAVSEDGGRNVSRFAPVLTSEALAEEEKGAALLRSKKLTTVGPSKLTAFKLEQANLIDGSVTAYACVDLSDVKVLESDGDDVTPASRPNRQTSRPSFVWSDGHLKLKANQSWSGASVC